MLPWLKQGLLTCQNLGVPPWPICVLLLRIRSRVYCLNVSTTPLRQCLPFNWTTLRGKHCRHPIVLMGVVDWCYQRDFDDFHLREQLQLEFILTFKMFKRIYFSNPDIKVQNLTNIIVCLLYIVENVVYQLSSFAKRFFCHGVSFVM